MPNWFGSNQYASNWYKANYFAGVKAAPAVVAVTPAGAGTGSSGGGRPFDYDEIRFDPPPGFEFAPPKSGTLFSWDDEEGKPVAIEPAVDPGRLIETYLEKIETLREELAKLRGRHWREDELEAEAVRFRIRILELEAEVKKLRTELATRKDPAPASVVDRIRTVRVVETSPSADSIPWLIASAVSLLVAALVPDQTTKWIGTAAGATFGTIAAIKLFSPSGQHEARQQQQEETVEEPAPAHRQDPTPRRGPLPIGRIRIR